MKARIAGATVRSMLENTEAETLSTYYDTLFLMGTGDAAARERVRRRF